MEQNNILEVRDLKKSFSSGKSLLQTLKHESSSAVKAVDGVSLTVYKGEVVGLVGESGCGKSSLAKVLTNLYPADSGDIIFEGKSIIHTKKHKGNLFGTKIQMIFQDPYASLNPRMTIRQMMYEILSVHKLCKKEDREKVTISYLDMVGMNASALDSYPSQFSGGQRQRISIARALIVKPDLLIADEAISALDVSIQAQIINLLVDLKEKLNLSMLFISHDLSVVRYISDRVAVMYLGKIMEMAPTEELYDRPRHPYTEILMKATPVIGEKTLNRSEGIQGEPPSPINIPKGCRFSTRCPFATEKCRQSEPELKELENGHYVACWYPLGEDEREEGK